MKPSRLFFLIPVVLLLILGLQVFLSMGQISITYDEFAHLPAGYSYLKTGDFRMYSHNPPLIKLITAFPLLFMEIRLPQSNYWDSEEVPVRPWFYGMDFMRANRTQYLHFFFYARLMTLFLSGLLGFLVFLWSREFYGTPAGCFSLFLYVFCPNILAQSGLATVDLGTSLTIFLAVYCFYHYLKIRTYGPTSLHLLTLFLSGITLGLALLSKFTGLLLLILYPILLGWQFIRSRGKSRTTNNRRQALVTPFLGIVLIAFLTVHIGYAFQGSFSPLGSYHFTSNFLKPLNHPLLKNIPVPLPFYYLKGFDNQKVKEEYGSETMLLGEVSRTGWWYYYLFVLLFKVPLPIFIFLILIFLRRATDDRRPRVDDIFLLVPTGVILITFSFVRLQLGIRYVLPIFPFLFVYLGQTVHVLQKNKKAQESTPCFESVEDPPSPIPVSGEEILLRKAQNQQDTPSLQKKPTPESKKTRITALIIGLSFWYLISSLSVYPNYLSYFNELAGGPRNGYRILSDANLDVGQGLIQLKKYLTEQGIERINLLYFGWVDPGLYGIQAHQFPNLSPHGVYAISVAYLQGIPFIRMDAQGRVYRLSPEFFEMFKNLEPEAQIANSIFIYKIPEKS
ncbi:MAG TPA: glycosyltransferase family 39 protein [Candidatus Limnocylindrales bacterium]|nr:glycosyltransferase family 39 protein [Candidatus Limnocylindrales bacterium]